jgi:shikimate dehydrogenase
MKYSLSPDIHMAALQALDLGGDYRLLSMPPLPGGEVTLIGVFERMRRGELQGLNVTVPHKQVILGYLDRLTPAAQAIGAVNTIFRQGEELVGDNTDRDGFLKDLGTTLSPAVGSGLVLGAGGAARAVAHGLCELGWQVWIAARRLNRAEDLADALRKQGFQSVSVLSLDTDELRSISSDCTLVVNATPVGMAPQAEVSPWPSTLAFPPGASVYDLVYMPEETMLIKAASKAGLRATTGLGMLIEQAALSFERWTSQPAPRMVMRQAALEAVASIQRMGGG